MKDDRLQDSNLTHSGMTQVAGPPTVSPDGRRLLVVSYHFPPGPGVGGLRWLKFAVFGGDLGWHLDIITAALPPQVPGDAAPLADLPKGTRVFTIPEPRRWAAAAERWLLDSRRKLRKGLGSRGSMSDSDPGDTSRPYLVAANSVRWQLSSPRGWVRAYNAWSLAASGGAWGRAAATAARRLAAASGSVHRALIVSSPPNEVIGPVAAMARRIGLPFILDMRDPWSLAPQLGEAVASPLALHLSKSAERRAIEAAALVVANTEVARRGLAARYPAHMARFVTVMNGWDEEALPVAGASSRFLVAFAGSIYLDRDPSPLFRAAARLISDEGLSPGEFGLEFMGHVMTFSGVPLTALARDAGIEAYVRLHPPRPRREALDFMTTASVLVSLPQSTPFSIPSKVFEYMIFPAWLLVMASAGSATAEVLSGTSIEVVDPSDEERIYQKLRGWLVAFRRGERPRPSDPEGAFNRKRQAQRFYEALERSLATSSGGGRRR